jgi:hypothetical protein
MPSLALAPTPHVDLDVLTDVFDAWRQHDVEELDLEPDDLQVLAQLRERDDMEAEAL